MASATLVAEEVPVRTVELSGTNEIDEHEHWVPSVNPWLIAVSVILPTFMEVLDTSIANVALNSIAGSMSVSYSQATWVLTSYLISNAVILPLTAWLGNRFQRKRFLLFCIFLFTASSLACGLSINLPMLLAMRIIQGIGGGALAPISQAILMESFPKKKQGTAQALFGLGVVVAPVIGPVLGGWLTDSYSWRWIFYINVPVGLVALWAIQEVVEDPPWVKQSDPGPLDVVGLVALSLWLGCQEVALDKGQEDDWLGSRFIVTMIALAIIGLVVFIVRELKAERPMVDLRILRNRNYAAGTTLIFITCVLLYGIGLLTPQFLQLLLGYTSLSAGLATSPLGLGAMVSMILVGYLASKIDGRPILVLGFVSFAAAGFLLARVNLSISTWTVFWPQIIAGCAMGFLFVPCSMLGTAELRRDEIGSATGLMSLMRNVGGSVGIAMVSTHLVRRSQVHQTLLAEHLTPENPLLQHAALGLQHYIHIAKGDSGAASAHAMAMIYRLLQQQSYLLAFTDVFAELAVLSLLSIVLIVLFRRVEVHGNVPTH